MREFGSTPLVLGAFQTKNRELLTVRLKMTWIASFQLPIIRVVGQVAEGILLLWAAWMADRAGLTVGAIAAYISYLAMLVGVLFSAGWMLNSIQRGMVSLKRIDEVMPFISSAHDPLGESGHFDSEQVRPGVEEIEARGVTVVRDGRALLRDVDLRVRAGQEIGILGTVGSGKSTLVRVLSGVEPVDEGEVLLGGVSLKTLPDESVRDRIRVVPDIPFLFTRSLAENVAFVDAPEELDLVRVQRALWVACFDTGDEGMPDGVHTLVGEKGISLSGGQKQRITLARAIYAGGDFLILDDVLSAVDHQTEREILKRLAIWREEEGQGAAIINISNRVSALMSAHEILVLHEGRVQERGSASELAASDGMFARILALQEAIGAASSEPGDVP